MESELIVRMLTHPYIREAGNFILRYLLAQPVDLDFSVLILLVVNGLTSVFSHPDELSDETLTVTVGSAR